MTDSLNVIMVHFFKDRKFEGSMGEVIRTARGNIRHLPMSLCIRSSWKSRIRGSERADSTVAETFTKPWASKNEHIKGDNAIKDHRPRMANGKLPSFLGCTMRRCLDREKYPSERIKRFL